MSIKRPPPIAARLAAALAAGALAWACAPDAPGAGSGQGPGDEPALGADGSPIAARVGDTDITLDAVRREALAEGLAEDPSAVAPGEPAYEEALEALIEQRLLALEAEARGYDETEEARKRIAAARERILGNILVETAVSEAVTDRSVERVYEEQTRLAPRVEEVRARHILVNTREEAEEAARLIDQGADFAQLAVQISQDPATRLEGGDLGYFTATGILPIFAEIAFATPDGAVSAPFQSEFGWHVLKVEDRRTQPRPELEEMRASIMRFLTLQAIQTLLEEIRAEHPVTRVAGRAPALLRADGAGRSDTPPAEPAEAPAAPSGDATDEAGEDDAETDVGDDATRGGR